MKKDFPIISRARIKAVDVESRNIGDGTTSDPTEAERAWIDLMTSTAPELETRKKRAFVCAVADVVEYDNDHVVVSYDGTKYTIRKPSNSLQIARAREYSVMDALEALNTQRCITVGAVPLPKDFGGVPTEVIGILSSVAEKFFFAPYY